MLSLVEGSPAFEDGIAGTASTPDDEASCVGVLDVPRNTIWVSRRDSECRIRAISAVGSTLLAKKGESSISGGNLPELELNSHIFMGERLTIYALIVAQRRRVCGLSEYPRGDVSLRQSP